MIDFRSIKLLLVGPPQVGKTSTKRHLLGENTDTKPSSTGLERPVEVSLDTTYHLDRRGAVIGAKSTDDSATAIWKAYELKELAQIYLQKVKVQQQPTDDNQHQPTDGNQHQPTDRSQQQARGQEAAGEDGSRPRQSQQDTSHSAKEVSHEQSDAFVRKLLEDGWNEIASNVVTHLEHSTTAYVIDTGGQPEFHSILPLLLRGPALYLLFFNLAESLDKCYNIKYTTQDRRTLSGTSTYTSSYSILHTLSQLLNSFACNRDTGKACDLSPIAVLLATHLDLVTTKALKEADRKLREVFSPADLEKGSQLLLDADEAGFGSIFVPIDNKSGTDIEAVQRFLYRAINIVRPEPVPVAILWLLFHFILRFHYEERYVCSFDECVELAIKCGIEKEHVAEVLKYIHYNLGTILYYDDVPTLKDLVICNPEILFRCISKLICRVYEEVGAKAMHTHGEIAVPIFEKILNTTIQESKVSSLLNAQYVIDLMTHFNIIMLMAPTESPLDELKRCGRDSRYLMPCLLRPDTNTKPRPSPQDIQRHLLIVVFECKVVPVGLVAALVVQLGSLQRWSISSKRYSNHFEFEIDGGDFIVELLVRHSQLELHCRAEEEGPVPGHVRLFVGISIRNAVSNVMALLGYTGSPAKYLLYCPEGHIAAFVDGKYTHIKCERAEEDCPHRYKASLQQSQWFSEVCVIILCILYDVTMIDLW